MSLPRGIRNNNPGNIIVSNIPWRGKIPISQNTDVGYPQLEQFDTMENGIRALLKNIYAKFGSDTNLTLGEIAYRWNPDPNPANVEAYTSFLEQFTKLSRNDVLAPTQELLENIGKAIILIEEGGMWGITDSLIKQAYDMTGIDLPHDEKKKLNA